MSIVKNLISKMKRKYYSSYSKKGEGTTFIITLPVKLDTVCIERRYRRSYDQKNENSSGKKITKLNLEVAQYILEDAGGKVSVAKMV